MMYPVLFVGGREYQVLPEVNENVFLNKMQDYK
jgi:hypothetical protein